MVAQHHSLLHQLLAYTPVAHASVALQAAFLAVVLPLLAVVVNVAHQLLLPRNPNLPPVVFHFVPIIGSAVTYGMDPYKFFFDCREKYGDVFTFVLLGRNVTVALGSKGSNLVLNGKLSQVSAEDAYTHLTTPVFGKEVVYDVPNHVLMEQKKFVKVGLSTDNFKVYVGQITDEVRDYIRTDPAFRPLVDGTAKTHNVDIFTAMCEITILTASRTLQGKEVREGLNKTFAQLYHDLDSGFTPINFVIPNLPLPNNFRRDRAQRLMSQFYQDIIAKRRREGHSSDEHDMISALMEQSYKNGRRISDVEIAHMMIALLMAGQHTSSATGSWALLRLASLPELIEELYEEQVAVYGDGDATALRALDYETQKSKLPKLDAVVRETLRMHPPIHSIMRKVIADMPVPPSMAAAVSGGKRRDNEAYVIPKGHYVLAAPGVSQVDPRVWKEADRFDPHRWLSTAGALKTDDQEAEEKDEDKVDFGWGLVSTGANSPYLPFGAGRHRCIGEQFAYLQLGTIIANFVRLFSWELTESGFPEPDYTSMVVLPKASRIRMTLRGDKLVV
nr:putative lanosterol 14 alpha-demethylase [Thecaphora frezii]UOP57018.1 putative lanosterol 14 alpha-demethylase [Thecaphora frezii]